MQFKSSSGLLDGLQTDARMREFTVRVGESGRLGGTDTGSVPVELLPTALDAYHEVAFRAFVTVMDIPP